MEIPKDSSKCDIWRAQKRLPECDNDHNKLSSLPIHTGTSSVDKIPTKRFKASSSEIHSLNEPVNKNIQFPNQKSTCLIKQTLSPITEISSSLSETKLCTSGTRTTTDNLDGTPQKRRYESSRHEKKKFQHFKNLSRKHDFDGAIEEEMHIPLQADEISENSKDTLALVENSDFQMEQHDHSSVERGARRLNLNESAIHQMAVDGELSFYDDESLPLQQERSYDASSQMFGLLSPEGSPQRFRIVEKSTTAVDNSIPPPFRQQKLQNASTDTSTGTTNSNVPRKSFRMFHSLSSGSMESSIDDEYMDLFEMESLEQPNGAEGLNFPSDLNSLISGHIKSLSPAKTPEKRRTTVRRCLSMTENGQQYPPTTPELLKQKNETMVLSNSRFCGATVDRVNTTVALPSCCFKRPDPPSATGSPVQVKRSRGCDEKENFNSSYIAHTQARPLLRKCMSMNDADIMTALARSDCKDEPDLIGDFSKPYLLPLMDGRHPDLKSVSSNTVARLINGEFSHQVANYTIIDCRYPYEFEGGHIRGAKNLYTQEQIFEEFLIQNQKTERHQTTSANVNGDYKRNIIVFHCEFSSERGPKLSRFLRNNDRARNTNAYPALDYPEIYLLHNGYKEFFETHAELCDPNTYRPMLEPSYNEAYRHFRAKSKSWNGDVLSGTGCRLKKSRSRLVL